VSRTTNLPNHGGTAKASSHEAELAAASLNLAFAESLVEGSPGNPFQEQAINLALQEFSEGRHMLSGRYQGRLLAILSRLIRPSRVLELGTFTGFGTLCLAEGLAANGTIWTIDRDIRLRPHVENLFQQAGLGERIHFHELDSRNLSLEHPEGHPAHLPSNLDLVFVDADKRSYDFYLDLLLPALRPGGLILFDNVLWKGLVAQPPPIEDAYAAYLRTFSERLHLMPTLQTVLLPVRDGLLCAIKL
jgi:caffeoyl-CoA O-methyltransferase